MSAVLKLLGFLLALGLGYLLLWPVPIHPTSWQAPTPPGYVGKWAPNTRLAHLDTIALGDHAGPEDITGRVIDGSLVIFTALHDGSIVKVDPVTKEVSLFANTGGRPLGLEFDAAGNLIVADAYRGLLSINPAGDVTVLADKVSDGSPIRYADDLDVASDGRIFFSDASTRFGAKASGGTLEGSLLALMEHSNDGRILVYNPADKSVSVLQDGFTFPNGIAICPDDRCILVAETGSYSVKRIWLQGSNAGKIDTLVENLPGFPDNLNRAPDGSFWLGLTSPRSAPLDQLSAKPFMRKIVQRLPAAFRPKAENYGFVLNFGLDGHVLNVLQDPKGTYPLTTGAFEPGDGWLYISSLSASSIGRAAWPNTAP
ncbi:MAG: SMP-30/gluconolactonase/LRE family protein [Robiginitomaculum sp.]|nr:SMP-30/gluconolactonase/LRE family protein [Robiginitomaculum sp.]MDQ7078945.1 SMP-30/gluconolactonase/LRE family protein [Robiginitomaculum sp.]